jgi:hypothetical protein
MWRRTGKLFLWASCTPTSAPTPPSTLAAAGWLAGGPRWCADLKRSPIPIIRLRLLLLAAPAAAAMAAAWSFVIVVVVIVMART